MYVERTRRDMLLARRMDKEFSLSSFFVPFFAFLVFLSWFTKRTHRIIIPIISP